MANFNEQLPDWEATGVEPPASKKTAGWQPDDKPPADWFNWFFNRAYKVMQEIRTVLGGHVDAAAPHSGHETPAGAQTKASLAEANAKNYTDGHAGTKSTHGVGAGYYVAKTSRSDQLPAYADIQDKPTSFPPSLHTHSGGDITSKVGSASAADSVPWSGVSEKPGSFAPSAHKSTHASGGSDALTPADIGAAPATAGGVTDTMIGNRTVSDAVPPTGDAGTITTLFSWLANMIKSITGKSNWRTAPATTLEAANTHINATSVHSATSAATANRIMMRDAAGRAKVAAPSASDDIARKSEVDTVQTNLTNHLNAADPHAQYALDSDLDAHLADTVQHMAYATASGTNTYTTTITGMTTLTEGLSAKIKFTNANTGASTLNVNGLGAKTIQKSNGSALSNGNIKAGQIVHLVYTGSVFQLLGEGGEYGTAAAGEVLSGYTIGTESGIVSGTLALSGNAVASDVLSGKTFYNTNAKSKLTGTFTIPHSSQSYLTAGTYTFTVPAGVTKLLIFVTGGGGGGSGAINDSQYYGYGGGGGGSSAILATVTPDQTIAVIVGAGGTGGVSASSYTGGGNGSDSSITISGLTYYGYGGKGVKSTVTGSNSATPGAPVIGASAGGWGGGISKGSSAPDGGAVGSVVGFPSIGGTGGLGGRGNYRDGAAGAAGSVVFIW